MDGLGTVRHSLHNTWKEIERVKVHISDILKLIEDANGVLKTYRTIEKELHDHAVATAPLLSPFQRVPPDILGEIAGYFVSTDVNILSAPDGLWPLTHVCMTWRSVILSFPHLWSTFAVDDGDEDWGRISRLGLVLKRAENHPLSFRASLYKWDKHERQSEIMQRMVKHSEQWKNAQLEGYIPPATLLPLHNRLSLLENLHLDLMTWFSTSARSGVEAEHAQRILEEAPKLTRLVVTFPRSFGIKFVVPNIQQLYDVGLSWHPSSPGSELSGWQIDDLSHFSNLSKLTLYDSEDDSFWSWDKERITLPALRHLELQDNLTLSPLSAIQAPWLESLILDGVYIDDSDEDEVGNAVELSRFLDHVERLSKLSIVNGEIVVSIAADLIRHSACRHLHTLIVEHIGSRAWVAAFLSRLIVEHRYSSTLPKHSTVLPHLRHLQLKFDYKYECGDVFDALRAFITPRLQSVDEMTQPGLLGQHGAGDSSGSESEDQISLARLEHVEIEYSQKSPLITLNDIHRLEAAQFPML